MFCTRAKPNSNFCGSYSNSSTTAIFLSHSRQMTKDLVVSPSKLVTHCCYRISALSMNSSRTMVGRSFKIDGQRFEHNKK